MVVTVVVAVIVAVVLAVVVAEAVVVSVSVASAVNVAAAAAATLVAATASVGAAGGVVVVEAVEVAVEMEVGLVIGDVCVCSRCGKAPNGGLARPLACPAQKNTKCLSTEEGKNAPPPPRAKMKSNCVLTAFARHPPDFCVVAAEKWLFSIVYTQIPFLMIR